MVPPAGATDTFVYTITDGDGDTSTVTLTITLTDSSLAASNDDLTVNEAALASGSNPASPAETVTGTVVDNVTPGVAPYTYALVSSPTGTHGTLTFNADGTYSYTLTSTVDGATANNGITTENNVESFTYQVTDANGNTATSTITIDVTDDIPTAVADTNSVVEGAIVTGNVLTDGDRRRVRGGRCGADRRGDRGCGGQQHLAAGIWRGRDPGYWQLRCSDAERGRLATAMTATRTWCRLRARPTRSCTRSPTATATPRR